MTDDKILKTIKYFDTESASREQDPWKLFRKGVIQAPATTKAIKDSKAKTDIYLMCLSNAELNDIVTMVQAANYDQHRKNDPVWNRAKKELPYTDIPAWRTKIGARKLSNDECITFLRSYSPRRVADDIYSFISMAPMTARQRNLVKRANMNRISNKHSYTKIETR